MSIAIVLCTKKKEKVKTDIESSQTTKRQPIYDKKLFDLLFGSNENHISKIPDLLTVLQKQEKKN